MAIRTVIGALLAVLVPAASATDALRVATYNVQAIDVGDAGYTALISVLQRLDADVILLQEITTNAEVPAVATLGTAAGYPYSAVADTHGTLTGNLRNAVLSRFPIVSSVSFGAAQISPDPTANDITRDFLQVEIAVPDVCGTVGFFPVHLKSGNTSTDKFRRAVEIQRVKKVIENWMAAHPASQLFLGGDFNEDVFDAPFGSVFNSLPAGLPVSYDLGSDISFPVVYDPFAAIAAIGGMSLTAADATHEDCPTCYATRVSSGRRIDYLFTRFATTGLGDEVYASPSDNGVDNSPLGNYLYKSGATLAAGTCDLAADHYPVFADYLLNSCDGSRYGAAYPGDHLLTPRAGIKGAAAAGSAGFGIRVVYGRPLSTAILVLGQAKLSPPFGLSTSPYVPGATLYVDVVTAYGIFPAATDAKGDSTFPLPLPNSPTVIGLPFESQWFVSDPQSPNGVGSMSDAYSVTIHA